MFSLPKDLHIIVFSVTLPYSLYAYKGEYMVPPVENNWEQPTGDIAKWLWSPTKYLRDWNIIWSLHAYQCRSGLCQHCFS